MLQITPAVQDQAMTLSLGSFSFDDVRASLRLLEAPFQTTAFLIGGLKKSNHLTLLLIYIHYFHVQREITYRIACIKINVLHVH